MQIVATNGAKDSTLEFARRTGKAAVAVAMTFSWAEAHDCFCDHFQVPYPSMLDTCLRRYRGRCQSDCNRIDEQSWSPYVFDQLNAVARERSSSRNDRCDAKILRAHGSGNFLTCRRKRSMKESAACSTGWAARWHRTIASGFDCLLHLDEVSPHAYLIMSRTRGHVRRDPPLGTLIRNVQAEGWEGDFRVQDRAVEILIDGKEEPNPALVARARELVAHCDNFELRLNDYLAQAAKD